MGFKVSKDLFGRIIEEALAELPLVFRQAMETVRVEVRDRPGRRILSRLKTPGRLLGLYEGRPRTRRSVEDSAVLPDVIYLFQGEIEDICSSEEELREQIRITVLHELGHHFGLGEENLDELGYG